MRTAAIDVTTTEPGPTGRSPRWNRSHVGVGAAVRGAPAARRPAAADLPGRLPGPRGGAEPAARRRGGHAMTATRLGVAGGLLGLAGNWWRVLLSVLGGGQLLMAAGAAPDPMAAR